MKCDNCGIVEDKKNHKEVNHSVRLKKNVCLGCYYRLTKDMPINE